MSSFELLALPFSARPVQLLYPTAADYMKDDRPELQKTIDSVQEKMKILKTQKKRMPEEDYDRKMTAYEVRMAKYKEDYLNRTGRYKFLSQSTYTFGRFNLQSQAAFARRISTAATTW
eukprot:SAG31_NODE_25_length_33055_cov_11.407919_20_plen_118_part_00